MSRMNRRQFLRTSGTFIASAALLSKLPACGSDGDAAGTYAFPQGVASGDPRPTSVVLWTRVQNAMGATGTVELRVEIASDQAFATVVANKNVIATADSDHTVRVIVTDLTPGTIYYYRFTAGGDSISGRTRTAPDRNADVPVHLAWVSCQDWQPGTFAAYRQMLQDDMTAQNPIEFVVHLGDFIYEAVGHGYQIAVDDNFQPTMVKNPDGSDRVVPPLPSGADTARTVDDYRHLYRHYLSDPHLQAARARWAFINTWDDHEFANDSWQSQLNESDNNSTDEPGQQRRVNASKVWFEYIPSQLSGAVGVDGVPNQAKDFTAATVTDAAFSAPNADNLVAEPNNVAAIGAITLYRSFRFGKHMELLITDLRSYRSDHAIPEELVRGNAAFFDPRNVLPLELVNVLDAGRTANGGSPPSDVLGFPNPRRESPPGTMLGAAQRGWVKETLKRSDATWKIWGNPIMFMRLLVKKAGFELITWDRVANADGWDGYPTERREMLTYLKNEGIKNVVSIAGDVHAHYAGLLHDDYDAAVAQRTAVGAELVAAGISSNSVLSFFEGQTRSGVALVLRKLVLFDSGAQKNVENLNMLLQKGTMSAVRYADTGDLQMALSVADAVNPHLKYTDTNAQGYGLLSVTAAATIGTLVTIERPIRSDMPTVKRTARFTIPKDNPDGMTGPEITGMRPVPFNT